MNNLKFFNPIQRIGLLIITILFITLDAKAITLTPSTSYDIISGTFSLNLNSDSGQDYQFRASPGTLGNGDDSVNLGSLSGNHFSNVSLDVIITLDLYRSGVAAPVGSATGHLLGSWSNILKSSTEDVAAGKQGEVSGGILFLNFAGNSSDFGGNFNFSLAADQKFANVPLGYGGGIYDNVIGLTGGTPFSVAMGNVGTGSYDDVFKTWYMGSLNGVTIDGKTFTAAGDIHTRLGSSAVPEPATLSLLGLSMLGGLATKRRKKLIAAQLIH